MIGREEIGAYFLLSGCFPCDFSNGVALVYGHVVIWEARGHFHFR
jgi:hypothetical protein